MRGSGLPLPQVQRAELLGAWQRLRKLPPQPALVRLAGRGPANQRSSGCAGRGPGEEQRPTQQAKGSWAGRADQTQLPSPTLKGTPLNCALQRPGEAEMGRGARAELEDGSSSGADMRTTVMPPRRVTARSPSPAALQAHPVPSSYTGKQGGKSLFQLGSMRWGAREGQEREL